VNKTKKNPGRGRPLWSQTASRPVNKRVTEKNGALGDADIGKATAQKETQGQEGVAIFWVPLGRETVHSGAKLDDIERKRKLAEG